MRDSLSKSVQMAIEISTRSIERFAQHEAKRTEQKARGELERQKLQNEEVGNSVQVPVVVALMNTVYWFILEVEIFSELNPNTCLVEKKLASFLYAVCILHSKI